MAQAHLVVVLPVDLDFLAVPQQVVQELTALLLVLPRSFCNPSDIVASRQ